MLHNNSSDFWSGIKRIRSHKSGSSYIATRKLKLNKNDGGRGLSTNHFKHGSNDLAKHTANLFSGILTHGSVTDGFCACSIVPIPKARNANLTDSENYRGIGLSSVFGRIFDLALQR